MQTRLTYPICKIWMSPLIRGMLVWSASRGGYQVTGLNVQSPPLPPSRAHLRGFPSLLLAFLAQMRTARVRPVTASSFSFSQSRNGPRLGETYLVLWPLLWWGKRNVTQRKSFEFRRFCLIGDLGLTMRSGGGVGGGGGDSTKATMQSLFKGKPILQTMSPVRFGTSYKWSYWGKEEGDAQKWT